MTSEQSQQLFNIVEATAMHAQNNIYTLTGAADWPILVAMTSVLGVLLCVMIAMIGFMWRDLSNSQRNDIEKLWKGMSDCQAECCPRGRAKQ